MEVKLKEKPQVGVKKKKKFFVKPSQSINKTVITISVEYIYTSLNRPFDLLSFIN